MAKTIKFLRYWDRQILPLKNSLLQGILATSLPCGEERHSILWEARKTATSGWNFPDISPEQLEMTLPNGQIGVEVRFSDSKTRLNRKKVRAGIRTLPTEAYMQIGRANFKVIPTSSLVA